MDDTPDIDYVDHTLIPYPSDGITFRALRSAHPDLFDVDGPDNLFDDPKALARLGTLVFAERLFARAAYETRLGNAGDVLARHGVDRSDLLAELAEGYERYGVATGRHQTEQLVRAFEARAAAQAGPARGPN